MPKASPNLVSALVSVSRDLATATHPRAIRQISLIAEHLIEEYQEEKYGCSAGLSPLARKVLRKCNNKTLDAKAIAMSCGMAPGGSTIKNAIRELIAAGHIVKSGAGLYAVLEIISAPLP